MNSLLRILPVLLLMVLLSACASTQGSTSYTPINSSEQQIITQLRRAQLEPIDVWNIRGRVAIQYGDEGFTAGLNWSQQQQEFKISLTDPLGRTAARLNGNDEQVTLEAQGESYQAGSAAELMQANLGWALPLASLYHWTKGIPDPAHPLKAVGYDTIGRPLSLIQDGWQVEFKRYPDDQVLAQPRHVSVARLDFKAKLVISSRD